MFFETNEPRTLTRYIGMPAHTERHKADVLRQNLTQGTIAKFHYTHERTILAKTGLLEQLGCITPTEHRGIYKLNHERFGYFTKQFLMKEFDSSERLEQSKDDLCVCSGDEEDEINTKATCQSEKCSSSSYRPHTHKSAMNRLSESNILIDEKPEPVRHVKREGYQCLRGANSSTFRGCCPIAVDIRSVNEFSELGETVQ